MVREVQLKTVNGHLDRPIQHLYPLELSCNKPTTKDVQYLNPDAKLFRPKRKAAKEAEEKFKKIANLQTVIS